MCFLLLKCVKITYHRVKLENAASRQYLNAKRTADGGSILNMVNECSEKMVFIGNETKVGSYHTKAELGLPNITHRLKSSTSSPDMKGWIMSQLNVYDN